MSDNEETKESSDMAIDSEDEQLAENKNSDIIHRKLIPRDLKESIASESTLSDSVSITSVESKPEKDSDVSLYEELGQSMHELSTDCPSVQHDRKRRKIEITPKVKILKKILTPNQSIDSDSTASDKETTVDKSSHSEIFASNDSNAKPMEIEITTNKEQHLKSSLRCGKIDVESSNLDTQEKHVSFREPFVSSPPASASFIDSSDSAFSTSRLHFCGLESMDTHSDNPQIYLDSNNPTLNFIRSTLKLLPDKCCEMRKYEGGKNKKAECSQDASASMSVDCPTQKNRWKTKFAKVALAVEQLTTGLFSNRRRTGSFKRKCSETENSGKVLQKIEQTNTLEGRASSSKTKYFAEPQSKPTKSKDSKQYRKEHSPKKNVSRPPPLSEQRSSSGSLADISDQESEMKEVKKFRKFTSKRKDTSSEEDKKKFVFQRQRSFETESDPESSRSMDADGH